jgi:hypothetical protein
MPAAGLAITKAIMVDDAVDWFRELNISSALSRPSSEQQKAQRTRPCKRGDSLPASVPHSSLIDQEMPQTKGASTSESESLSR